MPKQIYEIGFQRARVTTTTTTVTTASNERITPTERSIGADFVPRDIIKFELADAKVPDFQVQQQQQQQRYQPKKSNPNSRPRQRKNRRQDTATVTSTEAVETKSDDKQNVSSDQSSSDSRVLSIAHPVPLSTLDRTRSLKQLPFSVQKAITHAMKQDHNIPFLDTIKYYFKDPTPKTTKLSGVDRLPAGAKLFSDSRIKQWWQLPPNVKATSGSKISVTTAKPNFVNDYVAYPLLRTYPVQYSMNVASDLVNGVGFLYGDRIYSKPYTYQKNINQLNSVTADIKPVVETKPYPDDEIINGVYRSTQSSIASTSPVVFPTSTESPNTQTFIKYYSAELPVPTNPDTGVPLSNDKATISLINKAVNDLKKHNPHLNVVPKRLEKDELVVHVTPKPDYFHKPTMSPSIYPSSTIHAFKEMVTDKNLVYLNKIIDSHKVNKPHIAGHAYVSTPVQTSHHHHHHHQHLTTQYDDLVKRAFIMFSSNFLQKCYFSSHFFRLFFVSLKAESGYAFGYRVRDYHTGNDFGHTQKRMTDGTTMGEYKILMPDGRTQNVKYKADDNGYQADVSYDV